MITGVFLSGSSSKRLELLKEVRPQATTFGFLQNAADPANRLIKKDMDNAARMLGIKLEIVEVKDQSELADAFIAWKHAGSRVWPRSLRPRGRPRPPRRIDRG